MQLIISGSGRKVSGTALIARYTDSRIHATLADIPDDMIIMRLSLDWTTQYEYHTCVL
jgi:hypothetical protein